MKPILIHRGESGTDLEAGGKDMSNVPKIRTHTGHHCTSCNDSNKHETI